jgi:hypothetical protein
MWNANYPSLYLPDMPGKMTVKRTVRSVDSRARNWRVSVSAPADVRISVPKQIRLNPGEVRDLRHHRRCALRTDRSRCALPRSTFKQGDKTLRFPVTLVRGEPDVYTLRRVTRPPSRAAPRRPARSRL